jgi:hypothetical protein
MSKGKSLSNSKQIIYNSGLFGYKFLIGFLTIYQNFRQKPSIPKSIRFLSQFLLVTIVILFSSELSTLSQTPLKVATSDFNGDGKSDVLWRHGTNGVNRIWLMNGATVLSDPVINVDANLSWKVAGAGDFNGDGKSDILWRNITTGQNRLWLMNTATIISSSRLITANDIKWLIVGNGNQYLYPSL